MADDGPSRFEREQVVARRQDRSTGRLLASVAVALSLLAASCGGGGGTELPSEAGSNPETAAVAPVTNSAVEEPSTSAVPEPDAVAAVADPPSYGEALVTGKFGAVYPGYNLTVTADMIELSASAAPDVEAFAGLLAVSNGVDIEVAAEITAPLLVQVSLPTPPNDTAIPAVLHLDDSGGYRVEPGMWDPESNTIAVWAYSFSDRFGGWWNPANWVEEVIQVTQGGFDFLADWVTGRTDPPPCAVNPPTWASMTTLQADSLHTCLQTNPADDGAERVEVFLKSNRATMQLVSYPGSADFVWVDNQPGDIRRMLATAMTGEPNPAQVLLLGGQSMSYGLRQPAGPVEFETRTTQTPTVVIANQLLGLLGGVQGDGATAVALAVSACVLEAVGVDLVQADVVPDGYDSLPEFGGAMVRCGFELLAEPDALVAVADEALLSTGMDVAARNDLIGRMRTVTDKVAPLATRLLAAVNVGGALTRSFDGVFDNRSEGLISVKLDAPAPAPAPAPATPQMPVLRADGIGGVTFGDDADPAIAYFVSVFGAPPEDSGWYDTGYDPNSDDDQCMTPFMRYLVWPSMTLTFAEYEPAAGVISERRTFVSYSYYEYEPGDDVFELATDRGIHLGSTITEAAAAYPNAFVDSSYVFEPDVFEGDFDDSGKLIRTFAGVELCQV